MAGGSRCPAGHERAYGQQRICPRCRRESLIDQVAVAEASLPRPVIAAAIDAVATNHAVLRCLAADPGSSPAVPRRWRGGWSLS